MKFKKSVVIIGISILSFALIGCGGTPEAKTKERNWGILKTIENTKVNANNIGGFLNENFGITVGYAGEVHYTT